MDALRNWALAVCVAAVAGSLAYLASPSGALQRVYKITISVFFLCAMLSPVLTGVLESGWEPEISGSQPVQEQPGELQSTVEEQVKGSFSLAVKELAAGELALLGVTAQEILVNVNTDGDGSIFITEIILSLRAEDENKQAEIADRILEKIGIEPVIQFRQEVNAQDGTKTNNG